MDGEEATSAAPNAQPPELAPVEPFWALVRADIEAATQNPRFQDRSGLAYWSRAIAKLLVSRNIRAVVWYRIAHRLVRRRRWVWLALLLRNHGLKISGAEINPYAQIGPGLYLAHAIAVGIGSHVVIGARCTLHVGSILGPQPIENYDAPVLTVIGDDVFVGSHAVVMAGLTVGDGAVIGANAVVMRDVEPNSIISSSPGRVVGQRDPDTV